MYFSTCHSNFLMSENAYECEILDCLTVYMDALSLIVVLDWLKEALK